ncbi:hypothetical protein HU200_046817 [Digitaria exilis]|uniref:Uncharacterized protein n=1 Tax=Digitaria exilis TaxID=1010633 RepID=A0A835AY09_9POAL|nr:hypothetical protein HU200_046817 [Digitaria exilis]
MPRGPRRVRHAVRVYTVLRRVPDRWRNECRHSDAATTFANLFGAYGPVEESVSPSFSSRSRPDVPIGPALTPLGFFLSGKYVKTIHALHIEDPRFSHVPSNKDYFPSESMNATVNLVREKLDKIQSGGDNSNASAASKKPRVDNRRRI